MLPWTMSLKSPSPSGDVINSSQCNVCHAAFPVNGVLIRVCLKIQLGNLTKRNGKTYSNFKRSERKTKLFKSTELREINSALNSKDNV